MAAVNFVGLDPEPLAGWRRAHSAGNTRSSGTAEAMDGGGLDRVIAGDLIRGGHANVLIGQPEGHWLEVKRQHYDFERRCRQDQAS